MFEYSLGTIRSQIVLKNAKIMNVFSNEWLEQDIAIQYGTIVGVGQYEGEIEIDLSGKYIVPGFIDAHMHIESSMLAPEELSKALLQEGTTTILADPHEIVNVKGKEALEYMLKANANTILDIYTMLPSSVPATELDTNGAGTFMLQDMEAYSKHPDVLGLGEAMRLEDVIYEEPGMMAKFELFKDKPIDGHAPGCAGKKLEAYRFADVLTDHESAAYEEALAKLRAGFFVLLRDGSQAHDLEPIVQGFVKNHIPFDRCAYCTDDKHIADILREGHISACIKKAIQCGVNLFDAYKMATINPAQMYKLKRKGAIAAGYQADLVILNDPETVEIDSVIKNGHRASLKHLKPIDPSTLLDTVTIPAITSESIEIKKKEKNDVIELVPNSLLTKHLQEEVPGMIYFEPDGLYNKLVVVERHGKNGNISAGILKGYGLKNGALASTISHDSHNMIIVGDNDKDILLAAKTLADIHGGYVLVKDHEVKHILPLPIGGLMSMDKASQVAALANSLEHEAHEMGVSETIDPFNALAFLSLPVIPSIRLMDTGLYDVEKQTFID